MAKSKQRERAALLTSLGPLKSDAKFVIITHRHPEPSLQRKI
jgi:hypothetical protein